MKVCVFFSLSFAPTSSPLSHLRLCKQIDQLRGHYVILIWVQSRRFWFNNTKNTSITLYQLCILEGPHRKCNQSFKDRLNSESLLQLSNDSAKQEQILLSLSLVAEKFLPATHTYSKSLIRFQLIFIISSMHCVSLVFM